MTLIIKQEINLVDHYCHNGRLRLNRLGENMIGYFIFGHTCSIEKKLALMWLCFQIEWLEC